MPLLWRIPAIAAVVLASGSGWAQTAPLSRIATVLPGITKDQVEASNPTASGPAGRTGLLTFELDDDFDAVQIGVENGYGAFSLDRITLAPSASYGPDLLIGEARDLSRQINFTPTLSCRKSAVTS